MTESGEAGTTEGLEDVGQLRRLASLIQQRNAIDAGISNIIGRPASTGHIGEYLASFLFDIELEASGRHAGFDGCFRSGPHRGRSVNVKYYPKREGILDMKRGQVTDYYLVLTGPRAPAASSRGTARPLVVQDMFLFEAAPLIAQLDEREVQISVATSLRNEDWKKARIEVNGSDPRLRMSASATAQLLQPLRRVDVIDAPRARTRRIDLRHGLSEAVLPKV